MSWRSAIAALGFATALLAPTASATTPSGGVVLNEISCEGLDWIELVNTTGAPVDVGGWLLTDDPIDRDPPRPDHRLTLPPGSEIAAFGTLVVERGAVGLPFGISCGEDRVRLADASATAMDEIAVPEFDPETDTWGRYPSGTGTWAQTTPTPGAPNEPSAADPDPAAWLFDPASVVEIDLSIPPQSRTALAADPGDYQPGTFSLTAPGGTYGPLDVGVRLKGTTSFRTLDGKAAFKLSFDEIVPGGRFLGLEHLTLNNMVQDPSMLREQLAYEIFRVAGVPAPRTGYAFVRVDGEDYGVYLNVETPNEDFLRGWFETTTHLYEGVAGADATPELQSLFEIDEGGDDRSDLAALVGAAAAGGDFSIRLSPVADLAQMTRMWAVERYIGHWDGYASVPDHVPNNYFLHSDGDGVFRMLPWGTDQTLVRHLPFVGGVGTLFAGCLQDPSCRSLYRSHVLAMPALVDAAGLEARAETTAAILAPWQELDPRRESTAEEAAKAVSATRSFIATRPADVLDLRLWGERPSPGPPPREPPDAGDSPPETSIVRGPEQVIGSRESRRRVWFAFASSDRRARFECRLDGESYEACASPHARRVRRGRHEFRVRAVDAFGNPDRTPALWSWRVRAPQARR